MMTTSYNHNDRSLSFSLSLSLSLSLSVESVDMELDGIPVTMTTFEPTKRMSTYLLAFIVSNFTYIQAAQDTDVQVRQVTTGR